MSGRADLETPPPIHTNCSDRTSALGAADGVENQALSQDARAATIEAGVSARPT